MIYLDQGVKNQLKRVCLRAYELNPNYSWPLICLRNCLNDGEMVTLPSNESLDALQLAFKAIAIKGHEKEHSQVKPY